MKMTACLLATALTAAHATLAHASPPSSSAPIHTFGSLAISPRGDRVASIENLQSLTSAEQVHGPVVVRSVREGRVLESIDPCRTCNYA